MTRKVKSEIERDCYKCGNTGYMARDCEVARKCFNCGKLGHTTRNCFQPKKVAAMSYEQRNDGRGFRREFQQSGQNASYRNEKSGTDVNETSVKTIH